MNKPFYQSKKFVYAVSMLIAMIVLAVLPAAFARAGMPLDPDSQQALNGLFPGVVIVFMMVIAGHTLQDALAMAKGAQPVDLQQAVMDVLSAIPLNELIREVAPPKPAEQPAPEPAPQDFGAVS
jgi:hypothetical protein